MQLHDVDRVIAMCVNHRMRKDVLDTIDSGSRVQLVWNRVRDPEAFERKRAEAEARRMEAEVRDGARGARVDRGHGRVCELMMEGGIWRIGGADGSTGTSSR